MSVQAAPSVTDPLPGICLARCPDPLLLRRQGAYKAYVRKNRYHALSAAWRCSRAS